MKFLAHDTVRVIANRQGHGFEVGEELRIIKTNCTSYYTYKKC